MTVTILHGDCRTVLPTLPAGSFQACVTSPPYFGLRSYLPDGHPDKAKEIGLEQTPDEYVAAMVEVFREVRRVLRDDGCLMLNIGDSYAGSWGAQGKRVTPEQQGWRNSIENHPKMRRTGSRGRFGDAKPKELIGIPWMLAFAIRADGWYWRSNIIWHKTNPMPESVRDRPTTAHEYVLMFTKKPDYFWDADASAEDGVVPAGTKGAKGSAERAAQPGVNSRPPEYKVYDGTRNARSVWTIATQPYSGAHFATMAPRLAERCIMAGTSERGACACCGTPWGRIVSKTRTFESNAERAGNRSKGKNGAGLQGGGETADIRRGPVVRNTTTGWAPICDCPVVYPLLPCAVLDPFGGAGTTGLVADRLGRDATLIELNPGYRDMAASRLQADAPLLAQVL